MFGLSRRSLLVGLALVALVLGSIGWYAWRALGDPAMLRATVIEMITAALPGAEVDVGFVSGHPLYRLDVSGLSLRCPLEGGGHEEVLRFDRLSLFPDKSELIEGKWRIKRITLEKPELNLTRHDDGSWTIDRWRRDGPVRFHHPCEIRIEGGRFHVQPADGRLPALDLENVHVSFHVKPTAEASWTGEFRHETGMFKTEGMIDFERKLARSNSTARIPLNLEILRKYLPKERAEFLADWKRFDLDVELSMAGSASWASGATAGAGQLSARLIGGTLEHPRLPYPVTGVTGDLLASDEGLDLRRVDWQMGPSRGVITGRMPGWKRESLTAAARVQRFPFSREVYESLPEEHRRSWERWRPEGVIDLSGWMRYRGEKPEFAVEVLFRDNALTCERFPYRVHGVTGKALLATDGTVDLEASALAGERPLEIRGQLTALRPDAAYEFSLTGKRIPLDDRIEAALPDGGREAFQRFAGQGVADVSARFTRREGAREGRWSVDADIDYRTLRCGWFNYPVENVTGRLQITPERVVFRQVRGRSGPAGILVDGFTAKTDAGPRTELEIRAENVPVDRELRRALTAISPRWEETWDGIRPGGMIDVDCRLTKLADRPVDLDVGINMARATLVPVAFPNRLERFEGRINHRNGRVFWDRLKFRHGVTAMECSGEISSWPAGAPPGGTVGGTLVLRNFHAAAMPFDADLREAMPPAYRSTLDFLGPDRPVDVRFRQFQVWWYDDRDSPPVIAFDGSFGLDRARLIPSVGLSRVSGVADLSARFEGQTARLDGNIALDTVRVAGFTANDVTAKLVSEAGLLRLLDVSGQLYEGSIKGFLTATTGDSPTFESRLTLVDGRLNPWVREISRNPPAVDGRVDAELLLRGRGSDRVSLGGNGRLHIRDADVVQMPLIQEFFRLLSLQVPTGRAFDDIDSQFQFRDRTVLIDRLELTPTKIVGPSVSLISDGPGEIDLDTLDLRLRMAIRYGRGRMRIPAFTELLNGAGDSLAKVRVRGTLYSPEPSLEPVPGLRRLLGLPVPPMTGDRGDAKRR
jgi:hypothetical protein